MGCPTKFELVIKHNAAKWSAKISTAKYLIKATTYTAIALNTPAQACFFGSLVFVVF